MNTDLLSSRASDPPWTIWTIRSLNPDQLLGRTLRLPASALGSVRCHGGSSGPLWPVAKGLGGAGRCSARRVKTVISTSRIPMLNKRRQASLAYLRNPIMWEPIPPESWVSN